MDFRFLAQRYLLTRLARTQITDFAMAPVEPNFRIRHAQFKPHNNPALCSALPILKHSA
jgi:hypothetical protein